MNKDSCKRNLFLVVNYSGIIPQKLHETDGFDKDKLIGCLSKYFNCVVISIDELANTLLDRSYDCNENIYFFCSSQIKQYKMALYDIATEVVARGGVLLPKIDFYQSHENKYFQELYKARVGINTPKATLMSHCFDNKNTSLNSSLPVVVKPYAGFASKGVVLVKSEKELLKYVKKNMTSYVFQTADLFEIVRNFVKKHIKHKGLYPDRLGQVVLQDFIPNLDHDWKVLVFENVVFVLKRYTRKNDFRASGSGDFDYSASVSQELIRFALATKDKLDTPFVSLDIAQSANDFSIIEYQSVHFGLATMINAEKCFLYENDEIHEKSVKGVDVEKIFAESLVSFAKRKFLIS